MDAPTSTRAHALGGVDEQSDSATVAGTDVPISSVRGSDSTSRRSSSSLFLAKKGEDLQRVYSALRYLIFLCRLIRFRRDPTNQSRKSAFRTQYKRLLNMRELVETEKYYHRALSICVEDYVSPMSSLKSIKEGEFEILFSNIVQLQAISGSFLVALQSEMDRFPFAWITEAFRRILPFFKMFSTYICNYHDAVGLIHRLQKRKRIVRFLKAADLRQKDRSMFRGYRLEDFLINPIGRLPRYRLLIQGIFRSTRETHLEYPLLLELDSRMLALCQFINATRRSQTGQGPLPAALTLSQLYDNSALIEIARRRPSLPLPWEIREDYRVMGERIGFLLTFSAFLAVEVQSIRCCLFFYKWMS